MNSYYFNPQYLLQTHKEMLDTKTKDKETLIVNAYGGAGAGKTTACLHITEELKKAGYVAEYVQEYAKELVWEENWEKLNGTEKNQFDILTEQLHRIDRLYGKVDYIVTDAPILLNAIYNKELTPRYEEMLSELYSQYNSFNFIVERDISKYEKEGRMQTLEESIEKDSQIKELLIKNKIHYETCNHDTISNIVSKVSDISLGKGGIPNIKETGFNQIDRAKGELHIFQDKKAPHKNYIGKKVEQNGVKRILRLSDSMSLPEAHLQLKNTIQRQEERSEPKREIQMERG